LADRRAFYNPNDARSLGADYTINYRTAVNLPWEVLRATGGQGVELVVETVGGTNLQLSLESLRPQGHISVIGFLSRLSANVNLVDLNLKRATLTGVSVGSRQDLEDMLAAIVHHALKPVVGATFPLAQTPEAFEFLKSGSHFRKVVITL
jgi:NADPH:quinone reductase-like Zn-dependent oxidoreductase